MYQLQLSVGMLKEHWERAETRAVGESIGMIPISQMPPWNDLCSELNWELHTLDNDYFTAKHHGFWGVYRLIALTSEGDLNKLVTLNRICGQDVTGTLYIGETTNLSVRLNQLSRSARSHRPERSHGAISKLKQIPILNFPLNKLGVALLFTGRDTTGVERDLIYAYINSFGEMPPLNYKL
jgi:hypothetical protein